MRGWLWFIRKFGVPAAYAYWRAGTKRGWMTKEQSDAFFAVIQASESALVKDKEARS